MFYELTQNPEVFAKVREEADRVLTDDTEVTYELLNELKFTEAVAKETLRLHPTAPMITRCVRKDITFGGHALKKGV